MNFVAALAYHFCLALPAAFTQPGYHLLAVPCILVSNAAMIPQVLKAILWQITPNIDFVTLHPTLGTQQPDKEGTKKEEG